MCIWPILRFGQIQNPNYAFWPEVTLQPTYSVSSFRHKPCAYMDNYRQSSTEISFTNPTHRWQHYKSKMLWSCKSYIYVLNNKGLDLQHDLLCSKRVLIHQSFSRKLSVWKNVGPYVMSETTLLARTDIQRFSRLFIHRKKRFKSSHRGEQELYM